MKVEDVKREVEKIRSKSGDNEAQHSAEDKLYRQVLQAIAAGAPNAKKLAAAALVTSEMTFSRWCA